MKSYSSQVIPVERKQVRRECVFAGGWVVCLRGGDVSGVSLTCVSSTGMELTCVSSTGMELTCVSSNGTEMDTLSSIRMGV